jgi:hypothetical protein
MILCKQHGQEQYVNKMGIYSMLIRWHMGSKSYRVTCWPDPCGGVLPADAGLETWRCGGEGVRLEAWSAGRSAGAPDGGGARCCRRMGRGGGSTLGHVSLLCVVQGRERKEVEWPNEEGSEREKRPGVELEILRWAAGLKWSVVSVASVVRWTQPNSIEIFRSVAWQDRSYDRTAKLFVFRFRSRLFRLRSSVSVFYARPELYGWWIYTKITIVSPLMYRNWKISTVVVFNAPKKNSGEEHRSRSG